jgi:hypothetical protein
MSPLLLLSSAVSSAVPLLVSCQLFPLLLLSLSALSSPVPRSVSCLLSCSSPFHLSSPDPRPIRCLLSCSSPCQLSPLLFLALLAVYSPVSRPVSCLLSFSLPCRLPPLLFTALAAVSFPVPRPVGSLLSCSSPCHLSSPVPGPVSSLLSCSSPFQLSSLLLFTLSAVLSCFSLCHFSSAPCACFSLFFNMRRNANVSMWTIHQGAKCQLSLHCTKLFTRLISNTCTSRVIQTANPVPLYCPVSFEPLSWLTLVHCHWTETNLMLPLAGPEPKFLRRSQQKVPPGKKKYHFTF